LAADNPSCHMPLHSPCCPTTVAPKPRLSVPLHALSKLLIHWITESESKFANNLVAGIQLSDRHALPGQLVSNRQHLLQGLADIGIEIVPVVRDNSFG